MKKLVLFLATVVLALSFASSAYADNKETGDSKKRPPIEDVIIKYGQGHQGGPRRSVEVAEVNALTTNVTCSKIGAACVVVLDKYNNVVDQTYIDASGEDEVSVVITNPDGGDSYTVVVLSSTSYDEVKVD